MQENGRAIDYVCSLLITEPVSVDKQHEEMDIVLPKVFCRVLKKKF